MPSRTSVNAMEDYMRVNEEQTGFHLMVERVGDLNVAGVGRARFLPLPAYLASLADFRYELQDLIRHTNAGQNFRHLRFRGMPPSYMEFTNGEACSALIAGAEQAHDFFPMSKSLQSLGASGFVPAGR